MPFTLTKEHVHSLLDPAAEGDWSKFIGAIDPLVHWIVVDPVMDPSTLAGTYNLQTWQEIVGATLAKLDGPLKMTINELDVIGNKLIFESTGEAVQGNGKPYRNRWCWIMYFSEETGKVITIREYMNSALTKSLIAESQ